MRGRSLKDKVVHNEDDDEEEESEPGVHVKS
jgi:hypothetical protein